MPLLKNVTISFMSIKQEAIITDEQTVSVALPQAGLMTKSQSQLARQDLYDSLKHWRIWLMLAYQDIKLRYRRSVLGPFWITISMAITVYSMGYLYSHLFRINFNDYFPYLVGGILGWSLISTNILDFVEVFILSENIIKQINLPYTIHIQRVAARNTIIFFHHLLIIVPAVMIFHATAKTSGYLLMMLIPGLLLIYINAFCYGIVIAMIGTRFRDVPQIIKSFISVVFFVTPVIWNPDLLPADKRFFISLNPFYSFIELIRAPLTGHFMTPFQLIMVTVITLIGIFASYLLFSAHRARIVYWI